MDPHTDPEQPRVPREASNSDAPSDLENRRARLRRRWHQPSVPESRVDRLIREARERGDFEDLPGLGKPLDLSGLDDPDWWVKKKIRDEGLDSSALLPPTLQLRREGQEYPKSLRDIRDEEAVRRILLDFNRRVKRERLAPSLGPASRIVVETVDVDAMVARWRSLPRQPSCPPTCGGTLSVVVVTIVVMTTTDLTRTSARTLDRVLLIGASRGLGLALADEWSRLGRQVVATVRGSGRTPLHDLAEEPGRSVEIETVDITRPEQVRALHDRLGGRTFDLVFVNAGVTNSPEGTVAETTDEEFARVMITNALSPLRVVETLADLVEPDGTIGVMSSGQGSVTNNVNGGHEVYRGSKAALNTYMRSYAARHDGEQRSLVLMAPGWVQTDLGGSDARLTIDDSIPHVVQTIDALAGTPGLRYVDYLGRTVPW